MTLAVKSQKSTWLNPVFDGICRRVRRYIGHMTRAMIASIVAVALLSLPVGLRHDLICIGPALGAVSLTEHGGHAHSHHHHHHHETEDETEDSQSPFTPHQHSDCCLMQAMAGLGLGTLPLAGVAVSAVIVPLVGPAITDCIGAAAVLEAQNPFRPPPSRTRLALLSLLRI